MAVCYGQSFKILCLSAQQWLFRKCLWVNYNGVSMVNKVAMYNGIMKCIYWSHWNLLPILLIRVIEEYHNDHRYSFWVTVLDIRCMITTYSLYISEQYQLDSSTWWQAGWWQNALLQQWCMCMFVCGCALKALQKTYKGMHIEGDWF